MRFYHWLGLIPFVGMLGGLSFVNQVKPLVLGMPFLLFWMVLWVILTSVCIAAMYYLDEKQKHDNEEQQ